MTEYSTTKYRGFNIIIEYDENYGDWETPRDWDTLGTMACFHRRYDLGDSKAGTDPRGYLIEILSDPEQTYCYEYETLEDKTLDELIELFEKHHISMPLYLYDHSGLTISTSGFSCPWDSGQIGFIFVSHQDIKKEYGKKRLTKNMIQKAEKILTGEVKVYDDYLTGRVFRFHIESTEANKNINCYDSCSGYYGYESEKDMVEEAKASIDYAIKDYKKQVIADYQERMATALFMRTCWAD